MSDMDTSRRSSTSSDDEQQTQRDRANKEINDIIDLLNAALLDERNTDGLCKSAFLDARLDKLIKLLEEENESLRCELVAKKRKLEAASAAINPLLGKLIKLLKEENESLRNEIDAKRKMLETANADIDEGLDGHIKHLKEKKETLRNKIDESEAEIEATNADINEELDIEKQRNDILRPTAGLKLRVLVTATICARIPEVTAIEDEIRRVIEDETRRIIQLLVDIRDAAARQHQANLREIRRLQAEIDAETTDDEDYFTLSSSSAESSSDD